MLLDPSTTENPRYLPFWTLIIFWLLFGIKRGAFLDTINFLCIGFIIYDILTTRKIALKSSLVFILLIYAIFSNLRIAFCGVWDQWHIFQPWRAIIVLLGVTTIVKMMYKNGYNWEDIVAALNCAIYLHAVIIVFTFFNLDARTKLSAITGFVDKSDLRTPGLTNTYGITSQIMSIPLFSKLLIKRSCLPKWLEGIGLFLSFLSLLFTARIGLYSLPFILGLILLRKVLADKLPAKFLVAGSVALLFLALLVYVDENKVFDFKNSDSILLNRFGTFFGGTLHHSLELYFSSKKGNPQIKSFQTIKEFKFNNRNIPEYIFGTGLFGRGDPFSHLTTDISYAHLFSMIGIFGLSLIILFYFLPIFKFPIVSPDLRFLFIIITIMTMVGNYKEATFLTRSFFSLWCILVCCMKQETMKLSPVVTNIT